MKIFLLRVWDSPTLMSWGSLATRLGGFAIVLPLVLKEFTPSEITVWLLFSTIVSLQVIGDVGFSQTFTRAFAFACGGANVSELADARQVTERRVKKLNLQTLKSLLGAIGPIYLILSLIILLTLAVFGTIVVKNPIAMLPNIQDGWIAWIVVILSTSSTVWGNVYNSYLLGHGRVALLRRWEMLTAIASIISALLILLLGGGLLELVCTQQGWMMFSVLRNFWLCNKDEHFNVSPFSKYDKLVFSALWPSAWRSGVGVLMSFGIVQSSGIAYAQFSPPQEAAKYLLALRVIQIISQFSAAPFYSKLPYLSQLRSQGLVAEQLVVARKGMRLAHWSFILGFLGVLFTIDPLLVFIGSQTKFVSMDMWVVMGAAFFAERVGAMHIQLYSTTNHIIWHIANGMTGVAMIVLSFLLYPMAQGKAFPLAMLIAYTFIYTPFSIKYSSNSFNFKVIKFELLISILPIVVGCFMVFFYWLYIRV